MIIVIATMCPNDYNNYQQGIKKKERKRKGRAKVVKDK
jgi:hypothetical protein